VCQKECQQLFPLGIMVGGGQVAMAGLGVIMSMAGLGVVMYKGFFCMYTVGVPKSTPIYNPIGAGQASPSEAPLAIGAGLSAISRVSRNSRCPLFCSEL